jgi:hypothetical protein
MIEIRRLLLLELEALPSTPLALCNALVGWDHNVTADVVVDYLRVLEADGLVSGPGISRLHNRPVWLTSSGSQRLRDFGGQFGSWRRVPAAGFGITSRQAGSDVASRPCAARG